MKQNNHIDRFYGVRFIVIPVTMYFILFILPTMVSFLFAFTDWNSQHINNPVFIGLENFKNIFISDDIMLGLKNTLLFTAVTTVVRNVGGLLIALIVCNKQITIKGYLRTVVYIPGILSMVVVGVMFTALLHPTEGMVNMVLDGVGLDMLTRDWLNDIRIAMYTICAVDIWRGLGFSMIIFLAGLQTISSEYYEAAMIDGASSFKRFLHITIPFIIPSFNVNFILSLISGLKVFEQVYILTNGGPGNRTQVVGTWIYKMFGYGNWGMGNALNILLTLIIAVIVILSLSILRQKEVEL